jgi:TIR domain
MKLMSDIFLSYAHEDVDRVKMIAEALERQGWSVFWDRTIPAGKEWRDVIGKALAEARCIVVAWSKKSITSSWVHEEADEGRERGILIPLLIDDVRVPVGFRSLQTARLVEWDGAETSLAFQKLLADMTMVLGLPPIVAKRDKAATHREETNEQDTNWTTLASDLSVGTVTHPAAHEQPIWIPVLLTVIGWAVGGAIGLAVVFNIAGAFGRAFGGAIGWGMGGAIGGFTMGHALRLTEPSIRGDQIAIFTIGWAIGGAIGGVLSWEFRSVAGGIIAGVTGGSIGGLITGHNLRLIKPSMPWTQVSMVAFGWAMGGGLGSVLSWAFLGYQPTTIFYAIIGAITGAIIGTVGGGLMFCWLNYRDSANRKN